MRHGVTAILAAAALACVLVGEGYAAGEEGGAGAKKAKRGVIFVIESVNADDIDRVELKTFNKLRKRGTYFEVCYTCPPTRKRKDKKFGTVVSNIAIVTGTVFWTRERPFQTIAAAAGHLGNSMNLAKWPSYNCINEGCTHTNTKAGQGAKFFRTATAMYREAKPVVSIIHPQDPGEGGRDDLTSLDSPHIRNLVATDRRIGEFLGMLQQRGELDSTLIGITGDHGYVDTAADPKDPHPPENETSWRTPLILFGPGVKAGETFEYSEHIDIVPTACYLMGIDPPADSVGRILDEALEEPSAEPAEEPETWAEDEPGEGEEAEEPPPPGPERKYMKHWFDQNRIFHRRGGQSERAADFYGHERFLEWGDFKSLDALLDHNDAVLEKLGIEVPSEE